MSQPPGGAEHVRPRGATTALSSRRPLPVLLLGLAGVVPGCSSQPDNRPADLELARPGFPLAADFPSGIVTRNNGIFTKAGRQLFLRGVAVPEVAWIAQRNDEQMGFFDHRLFNAAADWGCDILRLSVMPAVWRRAGEAHVMRALDMSVAYARRCGLYLSICWHSIGFPPTERYKDLTDVHYGPLFETTTAETRDFWTRIAARYAKEDVVAYFDLFNEPQYILPDGNLATEHTEPMWVAYREWVEGLVDAIRVHAPEKPVCVGGLQFAYDLSMAPDLPIRRPNVIYATHPYPDSNWRLPWSRAFLEPGEKLPVIATEFGWDRQHHPESSLRSSNGLYRDLLLNALDQAAMGWQAWCFSHIFTPALLANNGFEPSAEYGTYVRHALLERKRASLANRT